MTKPGAFPEPRTEAGRDGLAAILADPGRALIAFDYDGTVAPIVDDPTEARPAPGGPQTLRRLGAVVGAVAVITGRPAAVVLELGDLAGVPGLLVAGQYGAERWRDGRLDLPEPPPGLGRAAAGLDRVLAGADPGVWVEDKRIALVVHTRRAADPAAALAALAGPIEAVAADAGLTVHPGRLVLELRPPGHDKGATLREVVAELRPAAVLFAGDDLGDLPAFEAVAALRADGLAGLTVASASAEAGAVAEAADLVVDGPAGVVALFAAIADAAERRSAG